MHTKLLVLLMAQLVFYNIYQRIAAVTQSKGHTRYCWSLFSVLFSRLQMCNVTYFIFHSSDVHSHDFNWHFSQIWTRTFLHCACMPMSCPCLFHPFCPNFTAHTLNTHGYYLVCNVWFVAWIHGDVLLKFWHIKLIDILTYRTKDNCYQCQYYQCQYFHSFKK